MIKVYLLDSNNFYISEQYVDPSYSVPKCVFDKPPEVEHNEVACYLNNSWVIIPKPYQVSHPEPIPTSITPRQARLKLLEADLLDNLEAVITTNRAWQIEWEYATEVKRDSPLIDAVASEASLTDEQIDQMFIEASKL
jgi:hypothetical protein